MKKLLCLLIVISIFIGCISALTACDNAIPNSGVDTPTQATDNAVGNTESNTAKPTESCTEKNTESSTEKNTESTTEGNTEGDIEVSTTSNTSLPSEFNTEASTEVGSGVEIEGNTEAKTESNSELITEGITEGNTESNTEVSTESNTETNTESNTEGSTESTDNNNTENNSCTTHIDADNNDYCDMCDQYLIVVLDFYAFNDLHGKFCDTATQPGVDEIGTYFENRSNYDDNIIILSSGDMWQGTAESSLVGGKILVEWMNELGFVSMTLGNHEFDWGEDAIRQNVQIAEFPFLAINIYNKTTGVLADYCTPSIMIERDGIQIGIIGAVGDCYSSVSSDMVQNVTFKVGSELTALVKAESNRLRSLGADIIVYSLHDGEGSSSYYDYSLSNGYVDVVFEAHTHQDYVTVDSYGVYHLQGGGENYGITHVELAINSLSGSKKVTDASVITNSEYKNLPDHEETEAIEDKYSDIIDFAYAELGTVSKYMSDAIVEDFVAQLYLEAGIEKWSGKYNIVLGGGFLRTRTPYNLSAGKKTYADIFSLFPFNNRIVLCSISGSKLKSKFINSTSSDYHIALSEYGKNLSISNSATYYVVVDTYTALYSSNGLSIVEYFDETTYARDLLADAIKDGRLGSSSESYTITSISDVLEIGKGLEVDKSTSEVYYVKGKIKSIPNATYGNIYIIDEYGNELYIFGLYDADGNRYGYMANPPSVGDTILVMSVIYRYNTSTVELKSATLIEIC